MTLPRIGITLGDPGGIGPEVTLKSLSSLSSLPDARYVLFGSERIIEEENSSLNLDILPLHNAISLHEVEGFPVRVAKGKPSPSNGRASFRCFEQAIQQAREGNIQAVVRPLYPSGHGSWQASPGRVTQNTSAGFIPT